MKNLYEVCMIHSMKALELSISKMAYCLNLPCVHSHWPERFRCAGRLDPVSFTSGKSFAYRH